MFYKENLQISWIYFPRSIMKMWETKIFLVIWYSPWLHGDLSVANIGSHLEENPWVFSVADLRRRPEGAVAPSETENSNDKAHKFLL